LDECFAAILTSLPAIKYSRDRCPRFVTTSKIGAPPNKSTAARISSSPSTSGLELKPCPIVGKYYDVIATSKRAGACNWHPRAEYAGCLPNTQSSEQDIALA
jgi:hypothetical protein